MADENVRVAVRVRPFNQREKDAKSVLIVDMIAKQTLIRNPKGGEEPKKFEFDYSYWSHDGFKNAANGYTEPDSPKYADQKKVYTDLGVGVLTNAWDGYNASLFAYGQTGSGKSYSVVGYGVNKGIVPMLCEEVFNKITSEKVEGTQYEVTFSMLEIYSEVVRDLLNAKGDKKQGLTVREDPKIGFYPQGLRKQLVASYSDISKLMEEGTSNRTIAATNMNATSSRAHTIVTISLVQKYKNPAGKEMAKTALVNLVDLAGSERADATGATGDRLKEGAAINLSLTSLGNVIAALADNSGGKNVRVPYRDSVLTKLLMNALGGNSKTIMIAAISPADINYEESLSTLRYADRAKQIKCKAVVNEDPTEKLIKSLQEENAKLKELLKSGGKLDPSATGGLATSDDAKRALEENEKEMQQMKQSYEEKLAEAKAQVGDLEATKVNEKAKTTPHFRNVNMDPSLSGKVKIILEGEGQKTIGLPGKSDIALNGLGISDPHGAVKIAAGVITIERAGQSKILLNGKPITGAVTLKHLDRLLFGSSQYFVFMDPSKKQANEVIPTFEQMQDEIAREAGIVNTDTKNMTKDEIECQGELVDLIPAVDEANQMSIALDKKVKFEVTVVSSEARGEYDGKVKPMVQVKNFLTGYEWLWSKAKFLDRKELMSQYYMDFKDNGKLDQDRFKNGDPFQESPDTPTQIGTVIIFAKSFAYLAASKGDYKITNPLTSKQAGVLNIEISPCDKTGRVLTDKDGIVIKNPEKDLLNKAIHFLVKINSANGLDKNFEDVYCQFSIFDDANMNKTQAVKGTSNPEFKFSKQFDLVVTPELLNNLLNKCLFIQVWGEQVHRQADPANAKLSTKAFFDREVQLHGEMNTIVGHGVESRKLDPEKQRMREDLKILQDREKKLAMSMEYVRKLLEVARSTKKTVIPPPILEALIESDPQAAEKILKSYADFDGEAPKAAGQGGQQQQQAGFGDLLGFIDEMSDKVLQASHADRNAGKQRNQQQQQQQAGQNQPSYACNLM